LPTDKGLKNGEFVLPNCPGFKGLGFIRFKQQKACLQFLKTQICGLSHKSEDQHSTKATMPTKKGSKGQRRM
jgi:hypothetical protein